ncbi:MAG: 4-(cytidine 5'-diphospho)-2-C-methyl-D-erythritol kinase [Candidatus Binatia bacterium]
MPSAFTLPSFAKINWTLRILGKRVDGYHELCTVFQTISLSDELTFSPNDELVLTCGDDSVPADGQNLIVRAAETLRDRYAIDKGARIHLKKRIPSPGGLGGGSSNAAIALIGLSRLWKIEPDSGEMTVMAEFLGSDVPFFLHGGTAIGTGRGEIIGSGLDINEKFMLVVTPNVSISTKEAFARIDASGLTKAASKSILRDCRFIAESGDLRDKTLINDFEASILSVEPEIARVKNALLRLGARQAMMSGSGASVFTVFDKEETRQAAIKALEIESNWRKFAVATISREEYRRHLDL